MAEAEPHKDSNPPGTDAEPQLISGMEAYVEAVSSIVAGTRLELCIQSYDLDRRIYGRPKLVDGIREFLLQHDRATLRIPVSYTHLTLPTIYSV